MKFINSAARAFDGICDGIDAIASSAQLLTNKVNKEIKIQQETAELDIRAEVFNHKVELAKTINTNIEKLTVLRNENPQNFQNIMNVLNGLPIKWEDPKDQPKKDQDETKVSTKDLF